MQLLFALVSLNDGLIEGPEAEDVKAGPIALVIFLLLIAAVVFLMFSMNKQLRRVHEARDAGVYGDDESAEQAQKSRTD